MNLLKRLICSAFLALCLGSTGIFAQVKQYVSVEHDEGEWLSDSEFKITLEFRIDEYIHLQDNNTPDENIIPTEIQLESGACFNAREIEFSEPVVYNVENFGADYKVFKDRLQVIILFEMTCQNSDTGSTINGALYYQPCNNNKCYFPRSLNFSVDPEKYRTIGNTMN